MKKMRRAQKDGLLSNSQMNEVKRRAKLITDALDSENDDKVEEIAIESIEQMNSDELMILGNFIENHGYFAVGEAIANSDLEFFKT
jgi:hypothetical protein